MRLPAQLAAGKFARRHARGEPRTSWNPVGLRWRRSALPVAPRVARSPLPTVSNAWFPQFHLHFGAAEKGNDRPRQSSPQPPHTRTIVWRQLRERLLTCPPMIARKRRVERVARQSLPTRESPALRHRTIRGSAIVTQAKGAQAVQHRPKQTHRDILAMRSRHVVEPGSRSRIVPDARLRKYSPFPGVPLQFAAPRQQDRHIEVSTVAHTRHANLRSVGTMDLAPELVWRARAKSIKSAVAETTGEDVTGSPISAARMASVRAAPPIEALQTRENANARPMAFDPAMVDRLAEDVIRRVERHVRIERERRGV